MNSKKPNTLSVEIEGKTIQQAIKEALIKLNATEQEVTIEVLKEEQKGLFGMQGAESAKVRVTLDHKNTPLPKKEITLRKK